MRTMPSTVGPVMSSYGPGARRRIMDDRRASARKQDIEEACRHSEKSIAQVEPERILWDISVQNQIPSSNIAARIQLTLRHGIGHKGNRNRKQDDTVELACHISLSEGHDGNGGASQKNRAMQPGKEGTLISKEYLRLDLDGTLPVTQYVGRCRNTLPTAVGLEGIAALPKATEQTAK